MAGRKFQIGNVPSSVFVDYIELAGKKQNIDLKWNAHNQKVDLGEPTSFLDHENLGCTQRQCEMKKDVVDNYRTGEEHFHPNCKKKKKLIQKHFHPRTLSSKTISSKTEDNIIQ